MQCGWLKDKFGLSWQIIPAAVGRLMGSSDAVKAGKAMNTLLKMKKIDIQTLEDAAR